MGLSLAREGAPGARTALGARPRFELAAVDRHALAHADEAVARPAAVAAAGPVVGDRDLDSPSP
jgi:hypothetical protein